MTKKVIAIVSVLKPVDDTRNYEKIANSLSNTNKYEINIIGFSVKRIPSSQNISFHPLFKFDRSSIKRISASFSIWRMLLQLKPELIIVTCAELLPVSILNKILFGGKIIYDVQENYYRNIAHTNTYPLLIRHLIALIVRFVELASNAFVDNYILAERIYLRQMSFTAKKGIVIENKALIPDYILNKEKKKNDALTFVYSGTIAKHYGIFEAVDFIDELHSIIGNIRFIIIGYAAQKNVYMKLKRRATKSNYITIIGGDSLVPHNELLITLQQADFCLMPYKKNKSTDGRIPTKLFECIQLKTPVIISPHRAWNSIIEINHAGIIHDFSTSTQSIVQQLTATFYGNDTPADNAWESVSSKLTDTIQSLV